MSFRVTTTHPDAKIPVKGHPTDAGWDVSVVTSETTDNEQVMMFNTHLIVEPPEGYYLELYCRSSLWKKGYMLANSCGGVIDPEYRGEIKLALLKFDPTAPNLELPQRVAQLIPRKVEDVSFDFAVNINLDTDRGDGGFGSTGN